jgi:hypothetical protein
MDIYAQDASTHTAPRGKAVYLPLGRRCHVPKHHSDQQAAASRHGDEADLRCLRLLSPRNEVRGCCFGFLLCFLCVHGLCFLCVHALCFWRTCAACDFSRRDVTCSVLIICPVCCTTCRKRLDAWACICARVATNQTRAAYASFSSSPYVGA